jgi:peptidyl-prolyl cis-trans isomerase SurA
LRDAKGDADFMQLGAMAAKENPKIKFQDLGYRSADRLPQLFYEAIRNTGGGQVANAVVKSPAGYHVLKVMDRRALVAGQAAQQVEPAASKFEYSTKYSDYANIGSPYFVAQSSRFNRSRR